MSCAVECLCETGRKRLGVFDGGDGGDGGEI